MICPHCQRELPENYSTAGCPFCGKDLSVENLKPSPELPTGNFNGRIFLCALLFPPLLTLISATAMGLIFSHPINESVSPLIALVSGAIGGVICGTMLGFQASEKLPARIIISILMSAIMVVICIMLCMFGCIFGGYEKRFG
jgi:hypothetical protein